MPLPPLCCSVVFNRGNGHCCLWKVSLQTVSLMFGWIPRGIPKVAGL